MRWTQTADGFETLSSDLTRLECDHSGPSPLLGPSEQHHYVHWRAGVIRRNWHGLRNESGPSQGPAWIPCRQWLPNLARAARFP